MQLWFSWYRRNVRIQLWLKSANKMGKVAIPEPLESVPKAREGTKKSGGATEAGTEQRAPAQAGDRRLISDISQSLPVVGGYTFCYVIKRKLSLGKNMATLWI